MKGDFKQKDLIKAVIELDDTEYVINENEAALIIKGGKEIGLTRLFDKAVVVFSIEEIRESLKEIGIIDHLD